MVVALEVNALDAFQSYVRSFPERTKTAARIALNQTSERAGLRTIRGLMRDEISFPAGYLEDTNRLGVTKRASDDDLQVVISGRQRPTSLARFVTGSRAPGKRPGGLTVNVGKGRTQALRQAFIIPLNSGPVRTDGAFNLGLAVRLKPEEVIANKRVMAARMKNGLYLLYGPSVDQVFRTVREEAAGPLLEAIADEFLRQFDRLGG